MGLGHSPRIVTENLVLALDAGNPKNYNAGISTNWMDKVGGNNGTLVGGTHHTDGPFVGAGYVEFDGTGDYLTTANHASDFSFGSSDFTMEFWINSTKTGRSDPIGWNYDYTSAGWAGMILNISPGSGSMAWYENANSRISGSGSWNDGSWHHIAVTRDGNSVRMFLDGTQVGSTYTTSHSYGAASSGLIIGAIQQNLGAGPVDGQISNVRVLKGTALYTSNFTPPTGPLTAVTNTVLLTCQGNAIADASSSAHTITANGDAAARLGFPASAFEFDGTDDNCSLGPSSDFTPGTGPFTIEMWIYPTATPSQFEGPAYYTGSGVNNTSLFWAYRSGYLDLINNGDTYTLLRMTYPTLNQWVHLVASRDASGYFAVYENGVVKASTTGNSDNYEQTEIYIGGSGAYKWPGKVSIYKMYKGKGLTAEEVQQNYNALKGRYV